MFKMRECVVNTLEELEGVLRHVVGAASESVWMSTDLHPDLYDREGVKDTVIQAAQRVQEFRLLIDGRVDPLERLGRLPWLSELAASGRVETRYVAGAVPHWVIVDGGAYMKLEKLRAVDAVGPRDLLLVVDADDTCFVSSLTKVLREAAKWVFDKWWDIAIPLKDARGGREGGHTGR